MKEKLNNLEIWDLLQRIDKGYEPTANEQAALESCVALTAPDRWLDKLPESIGRLGALKELHLSGTKLTKLPETVSCIIKCPKQNKNSSIARSLLQCKLAKEQVRRPKLWSETIIPQSRGKVNT